VNALTQAGCHIEYIGEQRSSLPIRVRGGGLAGGDIELKANVSSQFVSSILLSAPYAVEPVILKLKVSVLHGVLLLYALQSRTS